MKFYLGTHLHHWLEYDIDIPLFISYRTIRRKKNFKPTKTTWALDSGGFSELSLYGKWTISPSDYVSAIKQYQSDIGNLDFCAIQDYMCEPHILKKTGLSIKQHQLLTCTSYVTLKSMLPETNFIPILQGWKMDDYLRHIDFYSKFGIDLFNCSTVGLGSVCRRQNTSEIKDIVKRLYKEKLNLHGFGVKIKGIEMYKDCLKSSDSLAWSFGARYENPLPGCTHKNCANCFKYATNWYWKIRKHIENS